MTKDVSFMANASMVASRSMLSKELAEGSSSKVRRTTSVASSIPVSRARNKGSTSVKKYSLTNIILSLRRKGSSFPYSTDLDIK